jgi:glycyl-tRNA synthetase
MESLYETNGLIFWSEEEIRLLNQFVAHFVSALDICLRKMNAAFRMIQIEAPILTPRNLINANYTDENIWAFPQDGLALRPETTMGSYLAAIALTNTHIRPKTQPPFVVWQHGKSFRREQDQVTKNMRLKEFWQFEAQVVFGNSTANDYFPSIVESMRQAISEMIGPCKTEASDRLPDYSEETVDIVRESFPISGDEAMGETSPMEVCSISRRKDLPLPNCKNIEVAIGTCRAVYNFLAKRS